MWQNNGMYGGYYDRMYGFNPPYGGNTMNMPNANTGYTPRNSQLYGGNTYNPRQLPPLQQQPQPQPQQQQQQQNGESQIRRLSRAPDANAAYPSGNYDEAASSSRSSILEAALPAIDGSFAMKNQTYGLQPQKRFLSGPTYTLQQTPSMRVDNNLSTYSARPHTSPGVRLVPQQQSAYGFPQPSAQRTGSFRRTNSGFGSDEFDVIAMRRIDSGFDSRPNSSFRAPGGLERQFSNLGRTDSAYNYGNGSMSGGSSGVGSATSGRTSGTLDRNAGGAGNSSLYRMYSFSNDNNGGGLNRGFSGYGSLYGAQSLYGGGGGDGNSNKNNTSLYGTVSYGNLRPTYSFAGAGAQGYGSGFALLDDTTDNNEFGGGSATPNQWSSPDNAEYPVLKSASVSPLPTIAPPVRTSGTAPRVRSQSAPANRSTSSATRQSGEPPAVERPTSGRRRRQRPQKRTKMEEKTPEVVPPRVEAVVAKKESPPPQPEELLLPVKRLSSAPSNTARAAATPFEQMRALRRVQTTPYSTPASQSAPSESTIGRRRGTTGGLHFSGAAVI